MLDVLQREGLGSHHSSQCLRIDEGVWGPLQLSGRKAVVVYMQGRGFNSFASNMIKLSVNETEWSSQNPRSYPLYFDLKI